MAQNCSYTNNNLHIDKFSAIWRKSKKEVRILTEIHPFKISINKTVNPAVFPITLKVLVAPALLLP